MAVFIHCQGNKSETGRILGYSKRGMDSVMKSLNIDLKAVRDLRTFTCITCGLVKTNRNYSRPKLYCSGACANVAYKLNRLKTRASLLGKP